MKIKIIIAVILLSFAVGIYLYPQMPGSMVSHWNAQGQPDGYTSKFLGLFLMPAIITIMAVLFLAIPKIDPLKENIKTFRGYYDNFILIIVLFMFYINALTVFWNLGKRFDLIQFLMPAFGLLFYYCGVLVKKAKRNFFIGIRTPWTLNNDIVWDKTHQLGGNLFKIAGVITLFLVFLPRYAFFIFFFLIMSLSVGSVAYSYFIYKKENITQNKNASAGR
jgi:uncharacterized membrane protein